MKTANIVMDIDTTLEKGHYLIALRGELDASSSIWLDDSIREGLEKNPLSVRIDCAELYYISSAGLGVFISHLQELQVRAIPLVLFALRGPVAYTFQVLGLDKLLKILPDRERAGLYCENQLTCRPGKQACHNPLLA